MREYLYQWGKCARFVVHKTNVTNAARARTLCIISSARVSLRCIYGTHFPCCACYECNIKFVYGKLGAILCASESVELK